MPFYSSSRKLRLLWGGPPRFHSDSRRSLDDDSASCIGIGMQHVYAHAIPMTSESVPACRKMEGDGENVFIFEKQKTYRVSSRPAYRHEDRSNVGLVAYHPFHPYISPLYHVFCFSKIIAIVASPTAHSYICHCYDHAPHRRHQPAGHPSCARCRVFRASQRQW